MEDGSNCGSVLEIRHYFYFCISAMFYVDIDYVLFIDSFFCIFYVYNFWDSRYRKTKRRGLLIGQPQGSLFESRWFVVFNLF